MNIETIERDLEYAITKVLKTLPMSQQKGNSTRFKNYIIRRTKNNKYRIFDCETNEMVGSTNFKISALAVVKSLIGKSEFKCNKIVDLDRDLLRHHNDIYFFTHHLKTSQKPFFKDIMKNRLGVVMDESEITKNTLLNLIYTLDNDLKKVIFK
jgi:nucleoside-triphosphatase THEP1